MAISYCHRKEAGGAAFSGTDCNSSLFLSDISTWRMEDDIGMAITADDLRKTLSPQAIICTGRWHLQRMQVWLYTKKLQEVFRNKKGNRIQVDLIER